VGFARCLGASVCHWGPYETDECLYQRALGQIAFLNSGRVAYKMEEPLRRRRAYRRQPGGALDCIHSISDINGFVTTGLLRGHDASAFIARHLSGHIKSREPQPWLYDAVMCAP